jgi:hypothetical protein
MMTMHFIIRIIVVFIIFTNLINIRCFILINYIIWLAIRNHYLLLLKGHFC